MTGCAKVLRVGELCLLLRDVLPADKAAVLALHSLVFGPAVDALWFGWKYGQDVHEGSGQAMGIWHGDELIAFCGGVPRKLWRGTDDLLGLQIGDVMVHPAWRGILTRHGPFFHVSDGFYKSRLGASPSKPFQMGFGFPSARHLRLAVLMGLLQDAGVMASLHWRVAPSGLKALPWRWQWQALHSTDDGFDQVVNLAWGAMRERSDGLFLGQRDAAYIRWRYVARPPAVGGDAQTDVRYRFFGLRRRWSGAWAGLAVLDLRGPVAQWLDWVGPVALMPAVCAACQLEAARAGATELTAWASSAVVQQLAGSGIAGRNVCAGIGVPVQSDVLVHEALAASLWFMGGDTDFL